MSNVKFQTFRTEVEGELEEIILSVLEEVGGELKSQVARNTAVDTGQLKGSWEYKIQIDGDTYSVKVGSPLENAIWEEFGTGKYAYNGDGRKGGWWYLDAKGDWHFTYGKRPKRALHTTYKSLKSKMIKRIQDTLKGGLS